MIDMRGGRSGERVLRSSWLQAGVLGALVCGLVAGGVVLARAGGPSPNDAASTGVEQRSVARLAPLDPEPVLDDPTAEPLEGLTAIEAPADAPGVAQSDSVLSETPT